MRYERNPDRKMLPLFIGIGAVGIGAAVYFGTRKSAKAAAPAFPGGAAPGGAGGLGPGAGGGGAGAGDTSSGGSGDEGGFAPGESIDETPSGGGGAGEMPLPDLGESAGGSGGSGGFGGGGSGSSGGESGGSTSSWSLPNSVSEDPGRDSVQFSASCKYEGLIGDVSTWMDDVSTALAEEERLLLIYPKNLAHKSIHRATIEVARIMSTNESCFADFPGFDKYVEAGMPAPSNYTKTSDFADAMRSWVTEYKGKLSKWMNDNADPSGLIGDVYRALYSARMAFGGLTSDDDKPGNLTVSGSTQKKAVLTILKQLGYNKPTKEAIAQFQDDWNQMFDWVTSGGLSSAGLLLDVDGLSGPQTASAAYLANVMTEVPQPISWKIMLQDALL